MMITSLDARAIRIPVTAGISQSTRTLNQRDYLLVQVGDEATDEVGLGISYIGTSGGHAAVECVNDILAGTVRGAAAEAITDLWTAMYQESLVHGRRGIVLRCIAAIDIALWDLAGKRADLPLSVLLGGRRGLVPAYASGGYYRAGDEDRPRTVAEEIEFNVSLGFADHKIKVGGVPATEDARRVAAALEVIDGSGRLAVDANNAYRTANEAVQATRILEKVAGDEGLWWMEEPLSPEDLSGHARVAESVATPIATGEIHQTRWEFLDLLQRRSAAVLQADAGVLGGITEWLVVARTAQSYGVQMAPHWHANLHVHLVAASENGTVVEHFAREKGIYNLEEVLTPESRLEFRDGEVLVPDRPGVGWSLDPELVSKFELNPSRG